MATEPQEVQILIDKGDLESIERAAELVDLLEHNPHAIGGLRYASLVNGLSQGLWEIVGTIRHAREVE